MKVKEKSMVTCGLLGVMLPVKRSTRSKDDTQYGSIKVSEKQLWWGLEERKKKECDELCFGDSRSSK